MVPTPLGADFLPLRASPVSSCLSIFHSCGIQCKPVDRYEKVGFIGKWHGHSKRTPNTHTHGNWIHENSNLEAHIANNFHTAKYYRLESTDFGWSMAQKASSMFKQGPREYGLLRSAYSFFNCRIWVVEKETIITHKFVGGHSPQNQVQMENK